MASIKPLTSAKTGKTTSFQITVSDGYDSSGKKILRTKTYKPPKGMSESKALKEAERFAVQFEDECKNGLIGSAKSFRLADFADVYLNAMKGKLSPTVYRGYASTVKDVIIPALGHFKLSEVKPIHVQTFVDKLYQLPKQERDGSISKDGKLISPATVKRKLAVLQSMLTFAVKLGYITNNPADSKRLTLAKATKPEFEIFTKQEVITILELLEDEPLQFQTLIHLAFYTSAREGELVGLKFSDIDFNTRKMTISRSAYKDAGKPVQTKSPKSNKTRTISLNASCMQLLGQLKQEHLLEECRLGTQWVGDDWVFTQWNGQIMHPTTPSKQFAKFLEKNGIPHRKFHCLRHTSATLLLYNGTDLKTVQERLGHADITTTNKYLHLIEQADAEAVNSLENLLEKRA